MFSLSWLSEWKLPGPRTWRRAALTPCSSTFPLRVLMTGRQKPGASHGSAKALCLLCLAHLPCRGSGPARRQRSNSTSSICLGGDRAALSLGRPLWDKGPDIKFFQASKCNPKSQSTWENAKIGYHVSKRLLLLIRNGDISPVGFRCSQAWCQDHSSLFDAHLVGAGLGLL